GGSRGVFVQAAGMYAVHARILDGTASAVAVRAVADPFYVSPTDPCVANETGDAGVTRASASAVFAMVEDESISVLPTSSGTEGVWVLDVFLVHLADVFPGECVGD